MPHCGGQCSTWFTSSWVRASFSYGSWVVGGAVERAHAHKAQPHSNTMPPLPHASTAGMAASVVLAEVVYDVSCNVILDSAMRAIAAWDVVTSMIKCWVFGTIISTGALD